MSSVSQRFYLSGLAFISLLILCVHFVSFEDIIDESKSTELSKSEVTADPAHTSFGSNNEDAFESSFDVEFASASITNKSQLTFSDLTVDPEYLSITVPEWERAIETITLRNDGNSNVRWSLLLGESEWDEIDGQQPIAQRDTSEHQALREEVAEKGNARVIVMVEAPVQLEANLTESGKQAQRREISDVQESVLANVGDGASSVWTSSYTPIITAQVNEKGLQRLFESDDILWVRQDKEDELHMDLAAELVGAVDAHEMGYRGEGQVVAILDGGIDTRHPYIRDNVAGEACFNTIDSNEGLSSLCGDGSTEDIGEGAACNSDLPLGLGGFDPCRHGTSVAGQVAGDADDIGGAPYHGMAPDAKLLTIAVCSIRDNERNSCMRSDQIRGLEHIFSLRDEFNFSSINMSIGGGEYQSYCDESDPRTSIINQLRSVGIPFVTSAGNDGWVGAVSAPACVSSAIAVGSVAAGKNGTTPDEVSSFSNSGSMVDFLAPGEQVVSSRPRNIFEGGSGTSRASPMVAGAWALVKSKWPDASIEEIWSRLEHTAVPITDTRNDMIFPRIQVDGALNEENWLTAGPLSGELSPGETQEITVAVNATHLAPGHYEETLTFQSGSFAAGDSETEADMSVEVTEQERAKMAATPDEIRQEARAGEQFQFSNTILNETDEGGQILDVSITHLPDFLTLEQVEGEGVTAYGKRLRIEPQATAHLAFGFRETVEEPTVFDGQILFRTNDQEKPERTVPVEIDVRTPVIALESETLVFKSNGRQSDESGTLPITIKNTGNDLMNGEVSITLGIEHFNISNGTFELAPGEETTIDVAARSQEIGILEGMIEISHDAPNRESPIEVKLEMIPDGVAVESTYPNPFEHETTIEYSVSEAREVKIEVYDTLGRRVAILEEGEKEPGIHRVQWNPRGISSGTYFVRLYDGEETATEQVTLVR